MQPCHIVVIHDIVCPCGAHQQQAPLCLIRMMGGMRDGRTFILHARPLPLEAHALFWVWPTETPVSFQLFHLTGSPQQWGRLTLASIWHLGFKIHTESHSALAPCRRPSCAKPSGSFNSKVTKIPDVSQKCLNHNQQRRKFSEFYGLSWTAVTILV